MSIGLLVPRSGLYPSIGFDLLEGLKAGLSHSGIQDSVQAENIGFGNNTSQIYASCEKFLMNGADVVAGYVNPKSAEALNPLFFSAGKLFISLDPGYHFPGVLEPLSNVINLSLEGAFCCKLLAGYAATNGAQKIAFTGSFYEAGYRSGFGYSAGVNEACSTIVFNHITKLKKNEFSLNPLHDFLVAQPTDAVLASFCGDMATDFYNHSKELGLHNLSEIYCSPFMAEELLLDQQKYTGKDMYTVVPWARDLQHEENKTFTEAIRARNRQASLLSLLGWEAAMVIKAIYAQGTKASGLINLKSPRGEVKCGTSFRVSEGPAYLARLTSGDTGNTRLETDTKFDLKIDNARRKWLENLEEATKLQMDNWHNAYLCIE